MRKNSFVALAIGGLIAAGAGTMVSAASATEARLAPTMAKALDTAEVEFTRHTREHRMWEIQRNMERGSRGHRYGHGYSRGYHRGWGPPPGHGYRRHYDRPPGHYYRY